MSSELSRLGFSDVDRDADPSALIKLLDIRSQAAFHQTYKRRAVSLLQLNLSLNPGGHVFDIGCGTGEDVQLMAKQVGSTGIAVGIDVSSIMVAEARGRSEHSDYPANFVIANAAALPFANRSFSGCLAIRTFQHLQDPQQTLTEVIRVLRPGSWLAVVDPDHDTAVIAGSDRNVARRFLNFNF